MTPRSSPFKFITCCAAIAIGLGWLDLKPHAIAQNPAPGDESRPVALSGAITLTQLIELVSQRLGVSVQYSSGRELDQSVTIRLREAVTDQELWEILAVTLEAHGLALLETEKSNLYRVSPLAQAAAQNQRLLIPGEPLDPQNGPSSTFVSIVIRLQSVRATELTSALGPILSNANSIRAIGASGLVLITDVRRRVEQALQLIELLDRPADPAERFVVEMTEAAASDVATLASQILAAQQVTSGAGTSARSIAPQMIALPGDDRLMIIAPRSQASSIRSLIQELDTAPAIDTKSYASPGVSADDLADTIGRLIGVKAAQETADIFTDQVTGAVLVTTTVKTHERIAELLDRLAQAPPAARRVIKPIRVRNRAAGEIVEIISELLSLGHIELVSGGQPVTQALQAPAPDEIARPVAVTNDDVTITVDESTNSIIAAGAVSTIEQIESLVTMLDERQPQVMITVSLITLSEGEALDVGVELSGQFQIGSTSVNLSSLFGLGSGNASGPLGGGTGLTGLVVNPGDFQAIVRALESINRGRTISTPKVLVNNNATATLRSVARQPFTSLNASDTVATTSFGGTQDAGTTVTITPQIAQGNHLILEYAIELSSFTGESTTTQGGGVVPPPSQQNSVDGAVTIPDGYTVVIGGVENAMEGKSRSHVPLVGRIPVLGWFFGNTSRSETRDRFYVFIHAAILRDPLFEDLKQLSGRDLIDARVPDGVPDLEPLWIE